MVEITFKNEAYKYDKSDPDEETSIKLLRIAPAEDATLTQDEIDSNAKSKTRTFWNLCYTINTYLLFILATLFIACAFLLFIYPLFDIITTARLRMIPSLPPFKIWVDVKPIVYCKVHVFTTTNAQAFLDGTDKKMKVHDLGPIIFREYIKHTDVVFHENSTLSYTVQRYLEFLPELNEPDILNRIITVPNIVLLGMAAQLTDYMFTVKMPFNLISRDDQVFVNKTINDYFWNFTTPALITAAKYVPFMVPQDNGGALHNVYDNYKERVNVRIGPKYSNQEFFTINTYDYSPVVPGFHPEKGECYADLKNASEGVFYPNGVTKDIKLWYWRKTVCRPVPLHFKEELWIDSLKGHKYVIHDDWYDRMENVTEDCYKGFTREPLPDGLSDVSRCYKDLPVAVSSPHFLGRTGYWSDKVEGYNPNANDHGSYAIIEPVMGVPLTQVARSQSNLVLPKLSGFNHNVNKFSKMVIPIIWLEYHQPSLTEDITRLLVVIANILPHIQYVVPVIFFGLGLLLFWTVVRRLNSNFSLGGYTRVKLLWRKETNYLFNGPRRN